MNSFLNPEVSLIAAFGAGILSFVSPCVLPIIPGYLSFISGLSFQELTSHSRGKVIKKVTVNTIFFILGFGLIFVLLGATASSLGNILKSNLNLFNKIAGVFIVIFLQTDSHYQTVYYSKTLKLLSKFQNKYK